MDILRQTPFPLQASYDGLDPSTDFILQIYDDHTNLVVSSSVTSDVSGVVTYDLTGYFEQFDETYSLYIYSLDEEDEPDRLAPAVHGVVAEQIEDDHDPHEDEHEQDEQPEQGQQEAAEIVVHRGASLLG